MQGPIVYKDTYLIVPRGGAYHIYSLTSRPIGHATSLKAAQDFVDGYSITATPGDPPLSPVAAFGREILKQSRESLKQMRELRDARRRKETSND